MEKISLNCKVYELVNKYPETADIMYELGFKDIINPSMLQTVGKVMTLAKGAKAKRIDLQTIVAKFCEHGYEIVEEDKNE